jgi:hypothetical protein
MRDKKPKMPKLPKLHSRFKNKADIWSVVMEMPYSIPIQEQVKLLDALDPEAMVEFTETKIIFSFSDGSIYVGRVVEDAR